MMTEKKLPDSPMRPGAPNYGNARGRDAAADTEGIEEENNPGVSPGSIPEPREETDEAHAAAIPDAREFHDRNYAQYMNRGDGRYVKLLQDQAEGAFGPDKDHGGETRRIHRQKSQ
ncbi:MAG: hypothetical protein WBB16_02585 [Aestuariivirga sp.]